MGWVCRDISLLPVSWKSESGEQDSQTNTSPPSDLLAGEPTCSPGVAALCAASSLIGISPERCSQLVWVGDKGQQMAEKLFLFIPPVV